METDYTSFTKNTWFRSEFKKEKDPYFHEKRLNYTSQNIIQPIIKTKKIKLYLTKQQTEAMKRMLGVYRYFYNRTIDVLKNYDSELRTSHYYVDHTDEKTKCCIKVPPNESLYNYNYEREVLRENQPKWIVDAKFQWNQLRLAIQEAIRNVKTNLEKGKKFVMKKKTKKN